MVIFMKKYKLGVEARRTLANLDDVVKPEEKKAEAKPEAKPKEPAAVPKPAPREPADAKTPGADWKAKKTCFHCNQVGHIKPECPLLKQQPAMPKKNGAIAMGARRSAVLTLRSTFLVWSSSRGRSCV